MRQPLGQGATRGTASKKMGLQSTRTHADGNRTNARALITGRGLLGLALNARAGRQPIRVHPRASAVPSACFPGCRFCAAPPAVVMQGADSFFRGADSGGSHQTDQADPVPLCRGLDRVRPLRAPGLAANETLLGSRFGWIATIHVEGRQAPYQNTTMDTRRGELLKRPLKTRLVAPAPDQASPTINNSIFTERGHFPANASQRTRRRARRSVRPPFETDIGVAAFQCGEAQTEPQAQRRHVVHRDGRGADCPAAPRSIENGCHERGPDPVVSPFR